MKYLKYPVLSVLIAAILIGACKKNVLRVSPFEVVDGKAMLKVNYSSPYRFNPAVRIKVNGEIVSSLINYSTPYPGGGLNTGGNSYSDYLAVAPGKNNIQIFIPKKAVTTNGVVDNTPTGVDSVILYNTDIDLKANVFQTIHITDTLVDATTNHTTHAITVDPDKKPDSGYVVFRFINLIPDVGPVDLYFGTTKVATGIDFKAASDTFRLPAGNSLVWSLRKKDSLTTLGKTYSSASTVANQRVFTVYGRGYGSLPTTDVRVAQPSFLYNK